MRPPQPAVLGVELADGGEGLVAGGVHHGVAMMHDGIGWWPPWGCVASSTFPGALASALSDDMIWSEPTGRG